MNCSSCLNCKNAQITAGVPIMFDYLGHGPEAECLVPGLINEKFKEANTFQNNEDYYERLAAQCKKYELKKRFTL